MFEDHEANMRTYAFVQAAQPLGRGGGHGRLHACGAGDDCDGGQQGACAGILDATGNVLFEAQSQASIAASSTSRQNWGAGMISGTTGIYVLNGLPDMSVPPLAQVNIFDNANIDANDTIATTVTLADPR